MARTAAEAAGDLATYRKELNRINSSADAAKEAATALEMADLAKLLKGAEAISAVAGMAAAVVQLGLSLAGVPSPEQQILDAIDTLGTKIDSNHRETLDRMETIAERLEDKAVELAWHVPIKEAIGKIKVRADECQRAVLHLRQGDQDLARAACSGLIDHPDTREDLKNQAQRLADFADDYLEALCRTSTHQYGELVDAGMGMLAYSALAWQSANTVSGLRMSFGMGPEDPETQLLESGDPLDYFEEQDILFGGYYSALASSVTTAINKAVEGIAQDIPEVLAHIVRGDGDARQINALPKPWEATEATAQLVLAQLTSRWPWMDFLVLVTLPHAYLYLAPQTGEGTDWLTTRPMTTEKWHVVTDKDQDAGVFVAAAPQKPRDGEPEDATSYARHQEWDRFRKSAYHRAPEYQYERATEADRDRFVRKGLGSSGDAVAQSFRDLFSASTGGPESSHIPQGGIAGLAGYFVDSSFQLFRFSGELEKEARMSGLESVRPGREVQPGFFGWATTDEDRLDIWLKPQVVGTPKNVSPMVAMVFTLE